MLVTNQTAQDYWFGPLHLLGGVGQTLTVDDTSGTSLYLTEDSVADAINYLYLSGKITVSSAAAPFPRPTGVPQLLHGDGSPEGLVFAPQGSLYMRRDGTGANNLYAKTTGVTINTGWESYTTTAVGPGTTYRKTTAKTVNNTTSETDLLNGEITIAAGVLGLSSLARLTAWGDWLQNAGAGAALPRFKLKLGATVLIDTSVPTTSTGQSATRQRWFLNAVIYNLGAANSQLVDLALDIAATAGGTANTAVFATGTGKYNCDNAELNCYAKGYNTTAVDTTVGKRLPSP